MNTAHRTPPAAPASPVQIRSPSLRGAQGVLLALALGVSLGATPSGSGGASMQPTGGMPSRAIPTQAYFNHFAALYDGDYQAAFEGFKSDLSGAIKTSQSR